MSAAKNKINEILNQAKREAEPSYKKMTAKTITEIALDLGVPNPSKSTLTELGMAFKELNLPTKRTAKGRFILCSDWSELYKSLEVKNKTA
jgi:hypothetical protein